MHKVVFILIVFIIFSACKSPEARRPITAKSGSFIDASVARNKKLNKREHAAFKKLMKSNPENNYIASNSGFWYYYETQVADSLPTPSFGDLVKFEYNIRDINNQLIYSKAELKPQNYVMDKQELFTGLREGLKLMRKGETATFLFPSQKAYGYYGDENKIGTNIPLICKVTVFDIQKTTPN